MEPGPGRAGGPRQIRRLGKGLAAFVTLTFFLFLGVELGMLLGALVLYRPEYPFDFSLFVMIPAPVPIFEPSGGSLLVVFWFLALSIIGALFFTLWRDGPRFLEELAMRGKPREHSALLAIAGLFCADLFFVTIYASFLAGAGAAPVGFDPRGVPAWDLVFHLARASVWEEVMGRTVLLGLPLLLLSWAAGDLGKRPLWRYFLGGGFSLRLPALVALIFSSVMFGLAHLPSWDIYKVFPSAVAGLLFGYLFLRFGLWAAIVLHFAFDFANLPVIILEGESFGTLTVITSFLFLFWLLAGMMFFVYYLIRAVEFFSRRDFLPTPEPAGPLKAVGTAYPGFVSYAEALAGVRSIEAPPPTAPVGTAAFGRGFVCPSCAGTEARFVDGKFHCTACGKVL